MVCIYIYYLFHLYTHTHTHTMEYYSVITKNEILHFQQLWWTWTYYAKWNRLEKKQILYNITYMWNLKKMKHTSENKKKETESSTDIYTLPNVK